ncbi:A/G-specific adenine glycosylase [Paracraurococcus lichenis]|uniref:Adenine DNA glycosylase n=1 Tax=Paracraurococcus lichenis TaxID=3064888 RepID=A0ABT9E1N0_9PROT|nr:A/G-specific adenine glycosylase [Paracraurococcus sp. LOR1-02]MDO9710068.1 A/G-specific adenine glycosylase [Paracraurococcus sp. LOR1-02]
MPLLPPAAPLLAWYDRHRRVLPFRSRGGPPDPYHVWLSEVMLQQTTVAAVGPRFDRFLARFPSVAALAAAPEGDVMEEWAGLGYYARARNLHACARLVAARGGFPREAAALRELPGIGAYTAAAVAAIAFDRPVVPVDGNVERVVARLAAEEAELPGAKPRLAALAEGFMADAEARARPGDFAQALFDLGATICTPRAPACALCPWREGCEARKRGIQEELPRKAPKRARPLRQGMHFLLTDAAGQVLLRRRPPKGLLGGMLEIPGTPWRDEPWSEAEALPFAPLPGLRWRRVPGVARHGFTHFELEMGLLAAEVPALSPAEGMEARPLAEAPAALPTVMRRLLQLLE